MRNANLYNWMVVYIFAHKIQIILRKHDDEESVSDLWLQWSRVLL